MGSIANCEQEPRARNQETRTSNQEPGTRNQEPRTKSQEPGAKNQEPGTIYKTKLIADRSEDPDFIGTAES
jgi:hypothetical protein